MFMSESHEERIHTEPVVLDIGGEIGALIIYTDSDSIGREIELSAKGATNRFHNQVHERRFGSTSLFAAVYPGMHAGEYDIWDDANLPVGTVCIHGGEVTTVDWRSTQSSA
jgi:hypothetical protein